MGLNTIGVGAHVTPTVVETWFSHYLNRKPLRQKPTAHISYHVGLQLIRQFLEYASTHTVEDLQAFTAQWVPSPRWVRVEDFAIPEEHITTAASHVSLELGAHGIAAVGGAKWWQWRPDGMPLRAEWIEMRRDYNARKQSGASWQRSMLYVHGGAYFFGSVDEHRYQMQRHARKLQARVLAPRYRLAPQFPFPCGLLDCLAAYLYLLTVQPPETIILAGDSAGGGMVMSMLVILRDQDIPMPAGSILLSPWVDLTHSFPSVAGDSKLDYVPPYGFWQKPSLAWPPPDSDEQIALQEARKKNPLSPMDTRDLLVKRQQEKAHGQEQQQTSTSHPTPQPPNIPQNLSLDIDGKHIEIKDQIQMYTTNALLAHPLVSPVMQPSLGGLPPMLIQVGGGEMLKDEQIYLAHKAAAPTSYPPPEASIQASANPDDARALIDKYPPTNVQLQVWDDLCHVTPTLSFTRPAKFMYRSIAQFGAWALARAQKRGIEILDDDDVSIISSSSSGSSSSEKSASKPTSRPSSIHTAVGRAGDPLPRFSAHMIRQRVTRHGEIYPLDPPEALVACTQEPASIGVIKPGPVRKWRAKQAEFAAKYAKEVDHIREHRRRARSDNPCAGALAAEETPPPTALAGRSIDDFPGAMLERKRRSKGLAMWSGWGSKHDEDALENEEKKEGEGGEVGTQEVEQTHAEQLEAMDQAGDMAVPPPRGRTTRTRSSRSRVRTVSYEGQMDGEDSPVVVVVDTVESTRIAENSDIRPAVGNQVFPFKLARPLTGERNPSTMTLQNAPGVLTEAEIEHDEAMKQRAVEDGEVVKISDRPEPPQRFVTASDGLNIAKEE